MKKRKILAMLLATALLLATLAGISAVGTDDGGTSNDTASTGTDAAPEVPAVTVRVAQVDDTYMELGLEVSAQRFQTVGAVLSYDATKLQPVLWTEDSEGKPIDILVEGEAWTDPAVISTKGPDDLAGKPALAYAGYTEQDGVQTPTGRSYLYLGADTLQYDDLVSKQVVTVRFRYCEGVKPGDITMPGVENPKSDTPGIPSEGPYTIDFAAKAESVDAIPGYPLLVTTGGGQDGSVMGFSYDPAQPAEDGLTAVFAFGGKSVNTGTGGGGYAITFFDWDGRVIDAISAEKNAKSAVETWQDQQWIQDRLSNKVGYEFDTWIYVAQTDDGLQSEHGNLTSRKANGTTAPSDAADFSDLDAYLAKPYYSPETSNSVLVQATYKTTEDVNGSQGQDALLVYDYTYYSFDEPTFYQYGAADANNGQYAVRCNVHRNSVLRADTPTVLAKVYVGSGSNIQIVSVKVDLENTDDTSFEVVVPKGTTEVRYQVRDSYGFTNWTNGTIRSVEPAVPKATIVREGAFALLVEEALKVKGGGSWDTAVNAQCFIDAGYTKVNNSNLSAAQDALKNATGTTVLTRAEADAALSAYK